MGFKLGDKVTWTSQANGGHKEKTGEIVKVIPPKAKFSGYALRDRLRARSAFGGGMPRDEESYVVLVPGGKTAKARPVLYWPLTSKLRLARKEPARSGSYAS